MKKLIALLLVSLSPCLLVCLSTAPAIAQCGPDGCPPRNFYSFPGTQCGPGGGPGSQWSAPQPRAGIQEGQGGDYAHRVYPPGGNAGDAAVRIEALPYAGSGIVIDYDEVTQTALIASATHIFKGARNAPTATLIDGVQRPAKVLGMLQDPADITLLTVTVPTRPTFCSVASANPAPGSRLCKIGFPAWNHGQRDFGWGVVTSTDASTLTANLRVRSGDSGGGILDESGFVVGIVSSHTCGPQGQPTDEAHGGTVGPIRALIVQIGWPHCLAAKIQGQAKPKPGGVLPPAASQPPAAQPPAAQPPATPSIDQAAQNLAAVLTKLEALSKSVAELQTAQSQPGAAGKNGADGKPGAQGPAGPAGPQGLAGTPADASALAAIAARVAALEAKAGQTAPATPAPIAAAAPPTRFIQVPAQ